MGTKLTISKDMVNADKLLKPGWFDVEATEYKEEPAGLTAKNPGSLNRTLFFRIISGEDEGVKLRALFSEVYAPLLNPLVTAMGGSFTEGQTYDIEDAVGKKFKVHVVRGEYKGKAQNEIDGFRPYAS